MFHQQDEMVSSYLFSFREASYPLFRISEFCLLSYLAPLKCQQNLGIQRNQPLPTKGSNQTQRAIRKRLCPYQHYRRILVSTQTRMVRITPSLHKTVAPTICCRARHATNTIAEKLSGLLAKYLCLPGLAQETYSTIPVGAIKRPNREFDSRSHAIEIPLTAPAPNTYHILLEKLLLRMSLISLSTSILLNLCVFHGWKCARILCWQAHLLCLQAQHVQLSSRCANL